MSRSIWKAPYSRVQIIQDRATSLFSPTESLEKDHTQKGRTLPSKKSVVSLQSSCTKIWSRAFVITPSDLLKRYAVYNGKKWVEVKVVEQMIGHRFGEFCSTRQVTLHKVNKQKQSRKPTNKRLVSSGSLGL